MKRRSVLKSASALAAASTVGLAGCSSGDDSGGSSSCGTPGDALADSFPDSADYEIQGEVTVTDGGGQEIVEQGGSAFYTGPGGLEYVFRLTEYSSESTASDETDTVVEQGSGYEGAVGYIQTGVYIFVAIGPDEDSVTDIMEASPTLNGCVDGNIEFA